MVGASSWHHTSNHFNETNHYDLFLIAEKLIEHPAVCHDYYESKKKEKKELKETYNYGVITVQIWGGTRKHPKLKGIETVSGIILGDWLYYRPNHNAKNKIKKYKKTSNKVVDLKVFENYRDLVKDFKKYKNSVKVFNSILKEKLKN